MKICTTEQEYINAIAQACQKVCKRYGYLPSVLIAQSCLQNGYGIRSYWDNPQIEALLKYNNMVGIKSSLLNNSWDKYTVRSDWSLTKQTPETYAGKNVIITDNFRKYDTIERSFADFLLFITYASLNGAGGAPKYGPSVTSIKDPEKLIKAVHSRGYATGPTYSTNVMKIVNKHGLTKYDDLSKVTATIYTPGYKIAAAAVSGAKTSSNIVKIGTKKINDITAANKSEIPRARGSNPINFIVVHYLGVPNADNPYLYGGGYGGHYNIKRDGSIYLAANPRTAVVWHCGGGLQGSGGHSFHGVCTNYNSIGIECGVAANTTSKDLSGDSGLWYFTEETQESLVYLVSKLMDDYKIPLDHVIRHYDVTGKICPNPYVKNNNYKTSWTWTQFKNNLQQYRKNGTITIPNGSAGASSNSSSSSSSTTTTNLKKGSTGAAVKTMQTMLIACGYSCESAGADGDFGTNTYNALVKFQKANGLDVDGIYGPKSKAALETLYKKKTTSTSTSSTTVQTVTTTTNLFLDAVKKVANMAKENNWKYDDSHAMPPCSDKKISCDRIIARALYDLGYTDQPKGGIVCDNIPTYLHKWGFIGTKKMSEIKAGAVVAVGHGDNIEHVFVVETYNHKTGICNKYDTGSDARIQKGAYFTNVKLLEWSNRDFVAAWNVPDKMIKTTTTKVEINADITTFNGVNYSAVYNYEYYKNKYADLRKAFGTNKAAYFKHFCEYGMKEARIAKKSFNVKKYKNRYEDLREAFGNNLPAYYKHYCIYGKKEGRKAT